jgi:hypothetical protein
MTTETSTPTLYSLLQLQELSESEQVAFFEEVGSVLLESATLRFLAGADPDTQEAFAAFTEEHGNDDDYLEQALQAYPDFGALMTEEIQQFETEMRHLITSGNQADAEEE